MRIHLRWLLIIMAMMPMVPEFVAAQTASDWQNTANYIRNKKPDPPGCDSLKWIGLESDCRNTDVGKYCKGGAIEECRSGYERAESLVKHRSNVLTGIEKNQSKASSEQDAEKKRELEARLDKGKKDLADVETDLSNLRRDLERRQKDAEACAAARGEIGKVFLRAVDKANGVSDPAAKTDAEYCASEWLASHKQHMPQRVDVNVIIEDCKSGIQVINRK